MSVRCPVCEAENPAGSAECGQCGKMFAAERLLIEPVPTLAGLEQTLIDPLESGPDEVERLPIVEPTMLARRDLAVQAEAVPGVEHTQIEVDIAAPVNWTLAAVEIDRGRELDSDPRTPAPTDTAVCPWCGAPSLDLVCDGCGRRKSRFSVAPAAVRAAASDDTVLCPACFARVATGPRCVECGVPFPLQEL